jgi:hypothetical protein
MNEPIQSLTSIMPHNIDQLIADQEEDKYALRNRK